MAQSRVSQSPMPVTMKPIDRDVFEVVLQKEAKEILGAKSLKRSQSAIDGKVLVYLYRNRLVGTYDKKNKEGVIYLG